MKRNTLHYHQGGETTGWDNEMKLQAWRVDGTRRAGDYRLTSVERATAEANMMLTQRKDGEFLYERVVLHELHNDMKEVRTIRRGDQWDTSVAKK